MRNPFVLFMSKITNEMSVNRAILTLIACQLAAIPLGLLMMFIGIRGMQWVIVVPNGGRGPVWDTMRANWSNVLLWVFLVIGMASIPVLSFGGSVISTLISTLMYFLGLPLPYGFSTKKKSSE